MTLARHLNGSLLWLVLATALAFAMAMGLRYGLVETSTVGLACDAGEESLRCSLRQTTIVLFMDVVFGWAALAAALFTLWRPSFWALGVALVCGAFGLVLYNTQLAGVAVTLALLSLARRAA